MGFRSRSSWRPPAVVVLSPEQIEARLQDRFRLLTGGARTAVARQRTLEATVDWSYELLSEPNGSCFSRLSVFPAAWTLDAAEHVCGGDGINQNDVLDLLSRLVGKSLVVVDSEVAGERRYRFLETVRQYARERLVQAGAADRLRERHFEFFFNEFRGARPILRGHGQLALLRRLRIEQENVRAALDWALTSAAFAETGRRARRRAVLVLDQARPVRRGKALARTGARGRPRVPGSLRARALIGLAHMHYFQGQSTLSTRLAEALSLGREADDAWVVSLALFIQGLAALERGDHEQAVARALEAREAASAGGEAVEHGRPLFVLGHVAVSNGDHDRAQQLYDESIDVHRRAGETWGLGILLLAAAACASFGRPRPGARAGIRSAVAVSGARGSARDRVESRSLRGPAGRRRTS